MIQLHPRSLLVGLVLGSITLLTMSQSLAPSIATVRVQYMPHPRDMVQIDEGTPYTVPVGKVFVLTGLGSRYRTTDVSLLVNGVQEASSNAYSGGSSSSVAPVPSGLTVAAGSTIDVQVGGLEPDDARAWGYLADQ